MTTEHGLDKVTTIKRCRQPQKVEEMRNELSPRACRGSDLPTPVFSPIILKSEFRPSRSTGNVFLLFLSHQIHREVSTADTGKLMQEPLSLCIFAHFSACDGTFENQKTRYYFWNIYSLVGYAKILLGSDLSHEHLICSCWVFKNSRS